MKILKGKNSGDIIRLDENGLLLVRDGIEFHPQYYFTNNKIIIYENKEYERIVEE